MFANYAARHFLGKHKVMGKGLRLKLIKKQAANSVWMWPRVSCTEETKEDEARKQKIEKNILRGHVCVGSGSVSRSSSSNIKESPMLAYYTTKKPSISQSS
ncbi:unnamed protein product [Pleuronectes platessa]|uniref:Uncharacterized protein n=1 Tax=Pleuronectes platessa TaxID=8262 RepID=A0A9N7UP38_PLEPL|nr:unnamed protein product [Pleuronectes platessa]